MEDVVVVSGARTPIASYGGSLKDLPANQFAGLLVKDLAQEQFGSLVLGIGKELLGRVALHDLPEVHK